MTYTRAFIISGLYLAALAIMWVALGNWYADLVRTLTQKGLGAGLSRDPSALFMTFGMEFIFPNVLGFAIVVVRLSSTRNFAPLERFLFLSVLAAMLTIPLALFGSSITISILDYAFPAKGILQFPLMCVFTLVPGFVTGQLLRFPRPRSVDASHEAASAV